jgi:integrase
LPLLFSLSAPGSSRRLELDQESEAWLKLFSHVRLAEGAHPRSVTREVSQLRSLAREAGFNEMSTSLSVLIKDPVAIARALLEPTQLISRSTGRARLVAVQRFIRVVAPTQGLNAIDVLGRLEVLLPSTRSRGWHDAGIVVAGQLVRRRPPGPTLDAADLDRIVEYAAVGSAHPQASRDRALVALACFSGLRLEEIVALRWEDLSREPALAGYFGLTASVVRATRRVQLHLPGPAAQHLAELAASLVVEAGQPSGPVFRARSRTPRPVGYRLARDVISRACRRAGLPRASSAELRAAFAWWLRAHGLSDHEVAEVLGLVRVRSVDRLLRRHAELQAQRAVRERLHYPSGMTDGWSGSSDG